MYELLRLFPANLGKGTFELDAVPRTRVVDKLVCYSSALSFISICFFPPLLPNGITNKCRDRPWPVCEAACRDCAAT